MDNKRSKLSDKPELPTKLKLENTMDVSGMWFRGRCYSLFWLLASSSTAPPMTILFARRRMTP
jgi:hypothetical protein